MRHRTIRASWVLALIAILSLFVAGHRGFNAASRAAFGSGQSLNILLLAALFTLAIVTAGALGTMLFANRKGARLERGEWPPTPGGLALGRRMR